MAYSSSRHVVRRMSTALVCMALAACAAAPVQEMSDARQAIKAARDAGAQRHASQTFSEAQLLLERAEASLQRRAYGDARRRAIEARGKAREALTVLQAGAREERS